MSPDYARVGSGARPRTRLPEGTCDTHVHVYGPQYAVAPTAPIPPPVAATTEVLKALHRQLGVDRTLIVQPTAYGFDNTATMDGVAAYGPGARAIILAPPTVTDAELTRYDEAGARGIRFFMLPGGVFSWDDLDAVGARCAALGWTMNLQLDGRTLPDHVARLKALRCCLVVDHIGKFLEPVTPESKPFRALLDLLDGGRCWVKISAPYEVSKIGFPGYDDVAALGRAAIAHAPERMLWASNFPHPSAQHAFPDDVALMDTVLSWFPNEAALKSALVDAPAELYRY